MSTRAWGIALLVISGLAALLLAFLGRDRLSRGFVFSVLALSGAGIGLGIGVVEGSGFPSQAIAAVVILALLTPFHARVVFGPLGRKG